MSSFRQLAAILFSDIVGYTALMGEDENKALSILEQNRESHKKLIDRYEGKYLKEMGDGTLATFSSTTDAVYCAGQLIQSAQSKGYRLKIALHEGEVVFDRNDVFGDGVNVAARIEGYAQRDQILCTASIARNVRNKAGIRIEELGEYTFKNVTDSMRLYTIEVDPDIALKPDHRNSNPIRKYLYYGLILIAVILVSLWYILQPKAIVESYDPKTPKTLAVLPVEYISDDPAYQYVSNGLFSELTSKLTKLSGMIVRPESTVRLAYDSKLTDQENAQKLDATHLLRCIFFTDGEKLRINASLIEAAQNANIWSNSYPRDLQDLVLVQTEIAQKVAEEMGSIITERDRLINAQVPTQNAEAYDLYLKGRAISNFSADGVNRAIKFFGAALELDPGFSLARSQLGYCYWYLAHFGPGNPEPFWSESWHNLREAIRLDSLNADAWANLNVVLHNWVWDSTGARIALQKAISLNPRDYLFTASFYYLMIDDYERADQFRIRHNQVVSSQTDNGFFNLYCEGKYDQALRLLENVDLANYNWGWWMNAGIVYLQMKQYGKAVEALQRSNQMDPGNITMIPLLIYAYQQNEQYQQAEKMLEEFTQLSKYRYVAYFHQAEIAMIKQDVDLAFTELEKSLEDHELYIHRIQWYPYFKPLLDEPRMKRILDQAWVPLDIAQMLE